MSYAQVHTQALRHRKVLSLSAHAFRVWVAGQCYCQEHLSDGVIPKVALVALGVPIKPTWVAELLTQELWHEYPDHYEVHDWADWNETREQVSSRRAARRVRHQRWLQKRTGDAPRDASRDGVSGGVRDGAATATATATASTTPQGPPSDLRGLWDAWRDVSTAKGAKLPNEPTGREIATLELIGQTYTPDEVRRAAVAFWAKPARARSLAYFAPQVGELLAPVDVSPDDDWRPNFFHCWTCKVCGEVHETDRREVYQARPCQKRTDVVTYAEWKAKQQAASA